VLRPKGDKEDEAWLKPSLFKTLARAATRRAMKFYAWAGYGFEAYGVEHLPPGPFIIASNHCSHLDTGAIVTACGGRGHELFVMGARDYFFSSKFKGWFFNSFLKVIPFDRNEHIIESLRLAQAALRAGQPVLIYPEGRRSLTGDLGPFKAGIGLLGVELGVPIVPCCVEGSFACLPKGKFLPRHKKIRVTFAPPVDPEPYRAMAGDVERRDLWRRVAEDARAAVERMVQQGKPR
jgi:1-acyl-sn-glycerol-3-phosphate acyltransferase